jgi:hypothetical protein
LVVIIPAVAIAAVALATLSALSAFEAIGVVALTFAEDGSGRGDLAGDLAAAAAAGVDGDTRVGAHIGMCGVGGVAERPE